MSTAPRRRPGPGWVPNQHGAWAMLLLPVLVGAAHAGPRWWHLLLLTAWLVAYLGFQAVALWLRARRRARYLPPARTYAGAAVLLGAATVLTAPSPAELLRWGVVYAPLLAASLGYSWRRADRSLVNDLLMVLAASLMAVVAHATSAPAAVWTGLGGVAGWLPGGSDPTAWSLAGVLLGYFAGTVLYVKTMIRERGNRRMYVTSVAYHLGLAAVVLVAGVRGSTVAGLALLFAALAVRAAVVPRVWPRATPRAVGLGEVAASVLLGVLLLSA
ncbi:MAG TPA: YwiC-like family protein [Actinotalea sp.]|nr:YwiC-like family protein [Actinotalea sp.]